MADSGRWHEREFVTMKETYTHKLVRQFSTAVEQVNSLKENYSPEDSRNIGKIAEQIIVVYEIFESGNIDKLSYEKGEDKPIPRLKVYFLEQNVFDGDLCLVLMKTDDPRTQYGYTRRKLLKFLRGEAVHGSIVRNESNSLKALRNYFYEENRHFKPAFAIRRDFLQFPNVISPNENDTNSPFDEPVTLANGNQHSLTTIESIVFSICNEMGHITRTGAMGWDKACISFDVHRFRKLLRDCLAENLIEQSSKWNTWNRFPIVDDGQSS